MKKARPARRLPPTWLRWTCPRRSLGFRTTAEVACCNEIIGQPRALAALRLGLEFQSPGYNVFVAGLTGTGKTTAIKRMLDDLQLPGGPPPDLCYVHSFRQPDSPMAIQLPAGRGRVFRKDMQDLVEHLRRALPALYESEPFKQERRRIEEDYQQRIRTPLQSFEQRVQGEHFQIVQLHMGPLTRTDVLPVVGGKPVPMAELAEAAASKPALQQKLPDLHAQHARLSAELEDVLHQARGLEREMRDAVQRLERELGARVVRGPLQDLREKHRDVPPLLEYLAGLEENLLDSLARFTRAAGDDGGGEGGAEPAGASPFDLYGVNLAVDNTGVERPPVVLETAPSYKNLFGSVERVLDRSGYWRSDYTMVRAGSLLRANGGYLVFNLLDVALEPAVWPTLKRVLKNMQAEIPSYDPLSGFPGASVKPEPVDLRLKVVLLGDHQSYQMLYDHDDEFRKIFKVKADFDSSMRRDRATVRQYTQFVATMCQNEGLLPFDRGGVAAVLETGARLAGRQDKLSTRFSDIADVIREAHYWAQKDGRRAVTEAHVDRAVRQRVERVNLVEAKLQEAFDTGQMLVEVRGRKVGQVNALTVFDFGDHVFGRPARITSQVSMGRSGIINIEREANLSGSSHDKGVLILAGYLRAMYAQDKPLTLSASLAFEQSYGGVEGDSASAAEVCALLSAIANVPLRQDVAVTGSVDQRGQLQPVGSVNEKIEGFFDVCRSRGLTGSQGVVIPLQNAAELMLRKDVVDAVQRRRFHVWTARGVDQVLELVTGIKAGRRRRYRFEADTLHRRVDDALYELAEGIKEFVDGADTPSAGGRPAPHGLADDESEEGSELGRRRRGARRRRAPRPGRRRRA
jgi:ATP-dependent Lon protease